MSTGFRLVCMSVYRPEYDDYAAMFVHGRPELSPPEPSPPPIPRDFLARLPGTPVATRPRHLLRRRHPRDVGRGSQLLPVADARGRRPGCVAHRGSAADAARGRRRRAARIALGRRADLGDAADRLPSCSCCARSACTSSRRCAPPSGPGRTRRTRACSRACRRSRRRCPSASTGASCIGWSAPRSPRTSGSSGSRCTSRPATSGLRRVHVRGWESRELLPERLSDQRPQRSAHRRPGPGRSLAAPGALSCSGRRPWPRSQRNGRGPLAWHDHCLLVPWFGDAGRAGRRRHRRGPRRPVAAA